MFDSRNVIPFIIKNHSKNPWWLKRIKEFDGLEIHPCQIIGLTPRGGKVTEPCEPQVAAFWTVCGHYKPNHLHEGIEDFDDFETEVEAQRFCHKLLLAYPHLAGGRHPSRQQSQD
jgi:hypothetical protein